MDHPILLELCFLALLLGVLVGAGFLIRHRWSKKNEPVPIPVAVLSWVGVVVLYTSFAALLYMRAPGAQPFSGIRDVVAPPIGPGDEPQHDPEVARENRIQELETLDRQGSAPMFRDFDKRIQSFFLYGVFGLAAVAYYTFIMASAISQRFVERIDPFSAHIEDPSEFSEARKLALRGDIDRAVMVYRSYTDNRADALFEAARLLKSHDRFVEAAALLKDITDRFFANRVVWADATYQLAKLYENHLDAREEASTLFHSILERTPETRFGTLAGNDLARIRVLGDSFIENLKAKTEQPVPPKDPHFDTKDVRLHQVKPMRTEEDDAYGMPPSDPFFVRKRSSENEPPAGDEDKSRDSEDDSEYGGESGEERDVYPS